MITDEQIRESEWQNGVYQLKKVVRFSGSEIFKDAEKCVEDLLDILNR